MRRARFNGDIKAFSSHALAAELEQIKIDFECGPGSPTYEVLRVREEKIRYELTRRNALVNAALEHEASLRGKGPVTLPDVKVETRLATAEVVLRIEKWLEATRTNTLDGGKLRDVSELIHHIVVECEEWNEILDD